MPPGLFCCFFYVFLSGFFSCFSWFFSLFFSWFSLASSLGLQDVIVGWLPRCCCFVLVVAITMHLILPLSSGSSCWSASCDGLFGMDCTGYCICVPNWKSKKVLAHVKSIMIVSASTNKDQCPHSKQPFALSCNVSACSLLKPKVLPKQCGRDCNCLGSHGIPGH